MNAVAETAGVALGTLYRYFSPLMRTIAIGPVPPHVIGLYDACRDALSASMAVIKPGITAGEAHGAAQDAIDAAGCTEYFKKRLGYAIGIGFKTWSEGRLFDLKAGDERELSAGMVFHMPPAVRIPNVCGAGVSETIVVTESGCERFGSTAPELFVR